MTRESGKILNYSKRESTCYVEREVRSVCVRVCVCVCVCVREREREREREIEREREREGQRQTERQTETDGIDVTIVALKWAMSIHFPLPKIRTFRFSLHKSRHHYGAELRNELTLSVTKKVRTLFSDCLKWREPRDE